MNTVENMVCNAGFSKIASMSTVYDKARGAYNAFDRNTSDDGKIYTGIALGGTGLGAALAPRMGQAYYGATGQRSRMGYKWYDRLKNRTGYASSMSGRLRGGARLAGLGLAAKGLIDYGNAYNRGSIGKKDLGIAGAAAGTGALAARKLLGAGRRGTLLGAGLGLAGKMYSDYRAGRV